MCVKTMGGCSSVAHGPLFNVLLGKVPLCVQETGRALLQHTLLSIMCCKERDLSGTACVEETRFVTLPINQLFGEECNCTAS